MYDLYGPPTRKTSLLNEDLDLDREIEERENLNDVIRSTLIEKTLKTEI
jgi:hypothetical protein